MKYQCEECGKSYSFGDEAKACEEQCKRRKTETCQHRWHYGGLSMMGGFRRCCMKCPASELLEPKWSQRQLGRIWLWAEQHMQGEEE